MPGNTRHSKTRIQLAGRKTIVDLLQTTVPYEYRDAATLLADFREMVDAVLREKGVIS